MFSGHSASLFKDTTHLFADFSKLKPDDSRVDVAEAAAQGVNCLKPEYIADYLIQVGTARAPHLPHCPSPLQEMAALPVMGLLCQELLPQNACAEGFDLWPQIYALT